LPHVGCDVELTLKKSEMLTLLGENGLGKTSLVQRIYQEHESLISMVKQEDIDFFYDRSLAKVKELFLEGTRGKISNEIFGKCWRSFNLEAKEKRLLSALSGGESQALKLCLGLSVSREIFILDEPSQFLDNNLKSKLSEILESILGNQKSILVVEHDLSWIQLPMMLLRLNIKDATLVRGGSWNT
jgi:ABC-type Mn2+/Zn2+ transport system ATPase subunit